MSTETRPHIELTYPFQLNKALLSAYDQFRRDEPIDIRRLYSGIDSAANTQVGLKCPNPLIAAFNLSLRENEVLPSEKAYFMDSSYVLLDPIRDFEGEDVNSTISSWLRGNPNDRRFRRFTNLIDIPSVGVLAAKGKSLGLFYEHLAGVLDLDTDSNPVGFNNPQATYFELLAADFLHGKGKDLILGFMKGSRMVNPRPVRFDRNYDAIEIYREEESCRWGVIAAGDLVAMEAWQMYLDYGASEERRRVATLAVGKYAKAIADIERLKDISAVQAREGLNPFQAL